jgi:uncharacterized YccA/Bax inhibitor family protein
MSCWPREEGFALSHQMLNEETFSSPVVAQVPQRAETMSIGGTIVKALFLVILTLISATFGWKAAADVLVTSGLWFFLAYLGLLALTIAAVHNPRIAAAVGILYALLMGTWVGAISRVYETLYDGIVAQALLATISVFIGCLLLYSLRVVRVTGQFVKVVVGATFGIFLLYMLGWLFSLFGVDFLFISDPGNPTGIAISLVISIVAALNLFIDFKFIESGVKAGAPNAMEWYSAFALLSTIIWLYVEVLRLIARLRSG